MDLRTRLRRLAPVALAGAALLPGMAFATSGSTDPVSSLVSAVNFSTVATDVITVATGVVAVLVAIRAATFIFAIVRK